MDGSKELGLGLIFTARFTEVSAAIDGLKAKLAELTSSFKNVGGPAAAETKKLGDAAKKAAKDLDDAAKDSNNFAKALKSAKGESIEYQKAMAMLTKEAGTSQIRFKDLTSALRAAESTILQTANTQFKSKQAAEEWASKVDRVKVAHAFMRDEMIRVDKQVLSATKGTKELVRIQDALKKAFTDVGMPANVLIGQLGNQIKTLPELKKKLTELNDAWKANTFGTTEASKAIEKQASIMNQLGQNGDKWAAGVNKAAVAQGFLKGEIVKANGEYLAYGKTSQQVTKELEKLTKGFSDSDTRVNKLVNSFGTGIKTFDDFKAALKGITDRETAGTKARQALLDNQEKLAKSYPTLSKSVEYLNDKMKAGEISYKQAGDLLSQMRIKQIENNKALDLAAKAEAKLAEQKENLLRKYKELGPVADKFVSMYGKEIKSIKDVEAALDSQLKKLNQNSTGTLKATEAQSKMVEVHKKAQEAIARVTKQVEAGTLSQVKAAEAIQNIKADVVLEKLNRQVKDGMYTQKQADEIFKTYTKTVETNTKESEKAAKAQQKLSDTLTNAASGGSKVKDYFTQLGYAIKQLAAWMPAALVIAAVTSAFSAGVQAVIEYDQALKNLQAITQATDAEVVMMGEKILEVSRITKYSATEIGAAMTTIGQAGFNAAQTIDIIAPAAQLAQGALEKMDVTADLVTTTLTVFGMKSHEAARAADVLAAAANWSKANLQLLRTAMNYVGPVAHSAGISLEETAAAMMQLFNVGLKASTVGTSFRQLIGAIEAPSAKLRKALTDTGISVEELNPKFERVKGQAQGLGGSLEVLNKVLKGDLQKSLHLFGIRVAGTALALANLGEDGFKLLVEQAGTVGSAAKMAEIQMGGLQVSMKNTANVAKNLAITMGQPVGEAFKTLLNILKPVLEVFTKLADTPFFKEIMTWTILTAAIIGLSVALKSLWVYVAEGIVKLTLLATTMVAQRTAAVSMAAANAAAAATASGSAAAYITLSGAFTTAANAAKAFYALLLSNPYVMAAAAIAALLTAKIAYSRYQAMALQASEKEYYTHQKNAEALQHYSEQLKKTNDSELARKTTVERLVQSFPQLAASIKETSDGMSNASQETDKLKEKEEKLAKVALVDYFKRLSNEYKRNKDELINLNKGVEYASGGLTFFGRRAYELQNQFDTGYLRKFLSVIGLVPPIMDDLGTRITKNKELTKEQEAAFIKLGVVIGKNGKTLEQFAKDSGVSIEELTKRFPTLQKVVNATIAAQEKLAKAGLTQEHAKEASNIIATMGDEWVDMYAKAGNAEKAFILDTVQNYNKKQDALVKSLEAGKITRSQFDQRMIEAEKQALEKVEKYQEDHYKKIESIVDTAYKNKQKAISDSFARTKQIAEDSIKAELALMAARGEKDLTILKRREELEKNLADAVMKNIKNEEAAQLELNSKKEALMKQFAEKQSNTEDVKKRLTAKINSEKLADDIATYTKSYEAYRQMMDKKIGEVEKWAAKVRSTEQEILDLQRSYADRKMAIEDKIRDIRRSAMDEVSQTQDKINQVEEKAAKFRQALADMQNAKDAEGRKEAYEKAKSYNEQMMSLADGVTKKIVQIDKDGNRQLVDDAQSTAQYRESIYRNGLENMAQMETQYQQKKQEQLASEKAMLQQSVDAMNAVSKSVTELGATLDGMNKKKLEVDTEGVLLQIKKLAGDISEVETKMVIGFVEAGTNEKIDVAVNKVKESIDQLKTKVTEQTMDLKVSVVDAETGEPVREEINRVNERIKKFGEDVDGTKPTVTVLFEGEGSAKLPLTEKVNEMAQKLEEFRQKISESSGYGVNVTFSGMIQDGPIPLTDAINQVQEQVNNLAVALNSSSLKVTIDTSGALSVVQELFTKVQELIKDWAFKVIANVYGRDDVDDLRNSIERLRDKTVTITTRYVSKGSAPTGYNKGGEIPGVGDSDTHPAILTPGEFVLRKAAVRKYGTQLLHMMNNMVAPLPNMFSSMMSKVPIPSIAPMALATEGPPIAPVNMGTLNLQVGNESFPVQAPISVLNELNTTLRRMRKAGVQ